MTKRIADFGDIPNQLATKSGMKYAYGILWLTWIDKGNDGGPAFAAKEHLRMALTDEERAQGIEWAQSRFGELP